MLNKWKTCKKVKATAFARLFTSSSMLPSLSRTFLTSPCQVRSWDRCDPACGIDDSMALVLLHSFTRVQSFEANLQNKGLRMDIVGYTGKTYGLQGITWCHKHSTSCILSEGFTSNSLADGMLVELLFDYSRKDDRFFNKLPLASGRTILMCLLDSTGCTTLACRSNGSGPVHKHLSHSIDKTWTVSSTNDDLNECRAVGLGPVQTLLHMATLHVAPSLMKQNLSTVSTVTQMTRHCGLMHILESMFRPICYIDLLPAEFHARSRSTFFELCTRWFWISFRVPVRSSGSVWRSIQTFAKCFQLFRLCT